MKAREAEITALENTIKESEREASFRALSSGVVNGDEVKINGDHHVNGINGDVNPRDSLSPETMKDFAQIRKSLELVPTKDTGVDLSLNRLDELMRYVVLGWFGVGIDFGPGRWQRKSLSIASW